MKTRPVAADLLHADRQTGGHRDRHDENKSFFCHFANVPKSD